MLEPGASVLLHSDGVAEAHDADREMFGYAAPDGDAGRRAGSGAGPDRRVLLAQLDRFTGAGREQEDDITLVALARAAGTAGQHGARPSSGRERARQRARGDRARVEPARGRGRSRPARLERLKTAVAEATMNAMEHGNEYRRRRCRSSPRRPRGGRGARADHRPGRRRRDGRRAATPDLEAKLAGEQTPRGWGLFLIRNMVDEVAVGGDETHHTLELMHAPGRRATMTTSSLTCTCDAQRDGRGDDRRSRATSTRGAARCARGAPTPRRPAEARPSICSTSPRRRLHQLDRHRPDRGLLARARAEGGRVARLRPHRALPGDLRDHPAVRLHDHRRGRGRCDAADTQGSTR